MTNPSRIALLAFGISITALGQSSSALPQFDNYPVSKVFAGSPVTPRIETPVERKYRTRIREGVAKGWGVMREGKEQRGPNFAGHYIVVQWGCGSPCAMIVVIDAVTGKIYYPPESFGREGDQKIVLPMHGLSPVEVNFRLTSRLWVMSACPDQPNKAHSRCYSYYYLWQDNQWRLLRRVRLKDDAF